MDSDAEKTGDPAPSTDSAPTGSKPSPTVIAPELWQKVQIILSQAEAVKYSPKLTSTAIFTGSITPDFVETPGLYERQNTQVDLLKKLYSTFAADVQEQFPKVLIAQLREQTAPVVAHALFELNHIDAIRDWSRIDNVSIAFWRAIEQKLRYEHWTLSADDLRHVASGMASVLRSASASMKAGDTFSPAFQQGRTARYYLNFVEQVLTKVQYVRLKNELLNIQNPAVDTDRRVLLSRLETLGFSNQLSQALGEIDRKTNGAATAFDFKTAMELVRTFLEEFAEEAAEKVGIKSSIPLPPKGKHFQPFKQYLRNVGIIDADEEEVLQKLYNYLSNSGSHVLGSTPEQFHVARTTVIEWCMMIAGRVQSYLA